LMMRQYEEMRSLGMVQGPNYVPSPTRAVPSFASYAMLRRPQGASPAPFRSLFLPIGGTMPGGPLAHFFLFCQRLTLCTEELLTSGHEPPQWDPRTYHEPMMAQEHEVPHPGSVPEGWRFREGGEGCRGALSSPEPSPVSHERMYTATGQRRQRRSNTTPEEAAYLERIFATNPHPDRKFREEVAAKLHWTPRSVQIWY
jgi:hypothetical protein